MGATPIPKEHLILALEGTDLGTDWRAQILAFKPVNATEKVIEEVEEEEVTEEVEDQNVQVKVEIEEIAVVINEDAENEDDLEIEETHFIL